MKHLVIIYTILLLFACKQKTDHNKNTSSDTLKSIILPTDTTIAPVHTDGMAVKDSLPGTINTGNITPDSLVNFAQTLIGTPYLYASMDPNKGFDCSGFITYVFNHFNIKVPRSSYEFANVGSTIPLAESKKGDLILFTGTDSTERDIGHIGIIVSNDSGNVQFIHSSSGKAYGVTVSPLDKYYEGRFVKVIRILRSP